MLLLYVHDFRTLEQFLVPRGVSVVVVGVESNTHTKVQRLVDGGGDSSVGRAPDWKASRNANAGLNPRCD